MRNKWWICGLLLCASTINYMDRVTLASVAKRVIDEFSLTKAEYGMVEQYFGYAFAVGAVVFGILVDRVGARWLYPAVLLLWSAAGMLTGLSSSLVTLLLCRTMLGFFESGHWPCALQTTQRVLEPKDRALGNSLLQSGVSIGAIVTPMIIAAMLTNAAGSWRLPFLVIGAIGMVWVVAWMFIMRDVRLEPREHSVREPFLRGLMQLLSDHRFWLLAFTVSAINGTWHIFRVWLPLVFQDPHGLAFTESETLGRILPAYYVMTDIGCLAAGAATVWLHRRGATVLNSRRWVFSVCALLMMLAMFVPALSRGELSLPGLSPREAAITVMMLVAAGSLGTFPCYYAFTQELSEQRMGLVTGVLNVFAWVVPSSLQRPLGAHVDRTGSYDIAFQVGAWPAIIAAALLWLFWQRGKLSAGMRLVPLMCLVLPVLALERPDVTFKVYQFPANQIPRIDAKTDDWAQVPESYAIGIDQLKDTVNNTPLDRKDLDVKVKVGWVKGLNRLYFLYEASDNYWDFRHPDLHNDIFEVVVDGDLSGGPFIKQMHPMKGYSPEEAHFTFHGVHAQNYHIFTPADSKDWTMVWGCQPWIKNLPYANAAYDYKFKHGESGKLTLEFFITPFDYAAYEGPERSVESKLTENKIIGMSWSVLDYDDDKAKSYRGFWNLSHKTSMYGNASDLVAFRLMPLEKRAAIEADWSFTVLDMNKRQVAFHDDSFGATAWKWEFGDGQTSTEQHPVHRYEKAGEYVVTLFVEGSAGKARRTKVWDVVLR